MKYANRFFGSVLLAVACLIGAPTTLLLTSSPAYAEPVRPEVGKPLQEAQSLMKSQRFRDALTKLNEADAVAGKTANESYLIAVTRFSAANSLADVGTMASAMDAIIATGRASGSDKIKYIQAVAVAYYRDKDYAHAATWTQRYLKEGGNDPQMRQILVQSYYLNNDCASVSRELSPAAASDSGARPSEEDLQLLLGCYERAGDKSGVASAVEKLVTYYPKKEYWGNVLSRIRAKTGFADRLDLDLDRIRLATGNLSSASDLIEMAQLSLEAGSTAEAKKVVDQGFATNVLGAGTDGDRHKRLRDLVTKQIADDQKTAAQREADAEASHDGDLLVSLGFSYVTAGQSDKGLAMMERGIARDSLRHPEDAKLHLGIAYLQAGKKQKGRDVLRTVKGSDGTQDIARLWLIYSGGLGA
jgi:hypothetical protein